MRGPKYLIPILVLSLAFSLACQWPLLSSQPGAVAINSLICVSFVAVGVVMSREFAGPSWNLALIVGGLGWPMKWIGTWSVGPFPFLSGWPLVAIGITGGQAMLMNPGSSLRSRLDRLVMFLLWIVLPVTQIMLVMTSRPEWFGYSPDAWWPSVFASHFNFQVVSILIYVFDAVLTFTFLLAMARRVRSMIGLDRVMALPVYVVVGIYAIIVGSLSGSEFIANPTHGWKYVASTICFACIPVALIGSIMFRRLEHATMSEVLHELFMGPQLDIASVEGALRRTLRDSTLQLRPISDADIAEAHQTPRNRLIREIIAPNGDRVAILEGDVGLGHHPSLLLAATHASGVALQNLRLQTDLRMQIIEVKESRTRVGLAALEERRRIERDLHDGIQQRLLAVVARLGSAQRSETAMSQDDIECLSTELRETLEDLRNLARGIHPQELRQFGFKTAVEVIAERLPLAITASVADFPSTPNLDATLYFVTCELLTNVVKHSNATTVHVDVTCVDDSIVLEVSDNGTNKSGITYGNGLLGCDDRVRTIGGDLCIARGDGAEPGTMVRVTVPACAS